jgi:hypothetical protein
MNNRFNLTPTQLRTREVMDKIIQIKAWFSKTDYYVNKIIRGEWTKENPKWVAYVEETKVKSVELEKLQEELVFLRKTKEKIFPQIQPTAEPEFEPITNFEYDENE